MRTKNQLKRIARRVMTVMPLFAVVSSEAVAGRRVPAAGAMLGPAGSVAVAFGDERRYVVTIYVTPGSPYWDFDGPEVRLPITVNVGMQGGPGSRGGSGCGGGGETCSETACWPPPPKFKVKMFDCADNPLDEQEFAFPGLCLPLFGSCGGGPPGPPSSPGFCSGLPAQPAGQCTYETEVSLGVCVSKNQPIPKRFEIGLFDGVTAKGGDCATEFGWHDGAEGEIPLPELTCDLPLDGIALQCLFCSKPEALPPGGVTVFKSARTLYPLAADDESDDTLGEAVNGEFAAPGKGRLDVVGVHPTNQVKMYGAQATAASTAGWHLTGSTGAPLNENSQCFTFDLLSPTPGNPYRYFLFHLLAGRGGAPKTVTPEFHWLRWRPDGCCLIHQKEDVAFEVKPLPCLPDPGDPAAPQLRQWTSRGTTVGYEVRLPCCSRCRGDNCPRNGNLADWFIVSPISTGNTITHGHARGWRLTAGGGLQAPGSAGSMYEFEN